MDVQGSQTGNYDRLVVSGGASIRGTLEIAFDAIAGVPGMVPLESAGLLVVTDLPTLMEQDIFGLIADRFPLDAEGQAVYPLIPASDLVPDIDEDADETWDEVTPMLSLAYHLPAAFTDDGYVDAGMFYLTYSEGFKSGTFEPIGVDGQAVVEPDTVDKLEPGFKLDFLEGRMRFNGALVQTDVDDMQLRQVVLDSSGTPRVVFRNASATRI